MADPSEILSPRPLSPSGAFEPTNSTESPFDVSEPSPEGERNLSRETELESAEDLNDPILELLEFSPDVMCPNMSDILIELLQRRNPKPCLLELARFFRAQARLLRRQATLLDELAVFRDSIPSCPDGDHGEECSSPDIDLDELLHQNRVIHFVRRSHPSMVAAHDRIDALEDCLYPWEETIGAAKCKEVRKRFTAKPLGRYTAFIHVNSKLHDDTSVSQPQVIKSLAARWKAMSENEKSKYDEIATSLNKEKFERKKRAKVDDV